MSRRIIVLLLAVLALGACGKKGPLYLPGGIAPIKPFAVK
ncbi:MAG: lipoprotein [Gammaproteobacteria bacterium]|nr:lipoprotein [Gammaproteobacteria bacterium]